MLIWLVFSLMTGFAALALLLPLARTRQDAADDDADVAFYRSQLVEIDRDLARGILRPAEAETARNEAGRRLLRAGDSAARSATRPHGEAGLRRRRAASAIALSMVPLVTVGLYGAIGSPHLPAQPLAARLSASPDQMDFAAAVARIEQQLTATPDDVRGWELLAPIYVSGGRYGDAARALGHVIRLRGETPRLLVDQAEALTLENGGMVPAAARPLYARALEGQADDETRTKARFYLALAAEQDGDHDNARKGYEKLLAASPPDAPWRPMVVQRLAAIGGTQTPARPQAGQPQSPSQEAAPQAQPDIRANPDIRAMVERLATRLETDGGDADSWVRLVRSWGVLGEREKAAKALERARAALAADPAALARLETEARAARIETGAAPQ